MRRGGQTHKVFNVNIILVVMLSSIMWSFPPVCEGVMDVKVRRRDVEGTSHVEPASPPQPGLTSELQTAVSVAVQSVEKEMETFASHGDHGVASDGDGGEDTDEGVVDEVYYYYYYYDDNDDGTEGEDEDNGLDTTAYEDEDTGRSIDGDVTDPINPRHYPGDPGYEEKCRKRRTEEIDQEGMEYDTARSQTTEMDSETDEGTMRHKSYKYGSSDKYYNKSQKNYKATKAPYASKVPKTHSPTRRYDCAPTRSPTRQPAGSPGLQPTRAPQPTIECDYAIDPDNCPRPTNPTGQDNNPPPSPPSNPANNNPVTFPPYGNDNGGNPNAGYSSRPSIRQTSAPTPKSGRSCFLLDCPRPTNPTE